MANFRKTKLALAASGSLVLTACGGGGGGGAVATSFTESALNLPGLSNQSMQLSSLVNSMQSSVGSMSWSALVAPTAADKQNAQQASSDISQILNVWSTFETWLSEQPRSMRVAVMESADYINAKSIVVFVRDEFKPLVDKVARGEKVDTTVLNEYASEEKINTKIIEKKSTVAEEVKVTVAEVKAAEPVVEETVEEPTVDPEPALTLLDSIVKATSDSVLSTSDPVVTTESIEETRVSIDANGSTVTEVYTIYTTTSTITVTTTTTVTKKQIKTWSDGSTTEEIVSTDVTTSSKDNVSVTQTEALKSRTVTANVVGYEDTVTSADTVTRGDAVLTTTSGEGTKTSLDANGSTVTEVYVVYTDTTTVPVTTTTTVTTTRTTTWTDGTTTQEVVDVTSTDVTVDEVSTAIRQETVSRTVTANVKDTETVVTSEDTVTQGDAVLTTTSVEDTRVGLDENGSTVTEVWTVYTDTTTVPVTTTTTTTTTDYTYWTDGTTTSEVASVTSSDATVDEVTTATREVLVSSTTTANVVSTSNSQTSEDTVTRNEAQVVVATEQDTRVSTDANGSTVTEVYAVTTTTTTVPVTTTTVVTDYRTTLYTDGTSVTEPVNVSSSAVVVDDVDVVVTEELVSSTTTPNVVSTSTSQTSEDTVTRGDAVVTTTSANETRTSLDDNGSTVTEVYTVYTDTTTVPVTTTTVVTDYLTTLYTDGTSVTEPTNVTSTDITVDEVSTATREEFVSRTVTANVASTSDAESTSTTTTVSDPVLQETIINTDTRPDGVWTFYYDVWVTTTTVTTTVTTTRTTNYTDGTSTSEVINTDTTESVTTTEQVKVRYTKPTDTTVVDPEAPESNAGTVVTQDNAPTLDYDPATYNASTYYNSSAMGTPTQVASHDPADFSTEEFDNGANSEIHANYAYARGWTGKGSTVMVMDTGVDTDHTDLVDQVKYEWDPGYDNGVEDTHGHGTHVAGIVAAAKNDTGTHGVAYDAKLAIAKIGESSASTFYARQALNWAKQYDDIVAANLSANMYNTYQNVVDRGNGIYTNDVDIDAAISTDAWAAAMPDELVLTMAAGNASNGYSAAPTPIATAVDADGNLKLGGRVLIVGNYNKTSGGIDGGQAGHVCRDYSNNTCNDAYVTSDFYILAPGIQVESTYKDGATKTMSGTSMASPVVAGAVAIVHQLWPYMKGENIAQLLLQTADKDLPNYSKVTHGAGLLDLDQATRPVGDLGISLTGRTSTTMALSGTLGANIDDSVLSSIAAVDEFDRDFAVDLSPAQYNTSITLNHAQAAEDNGWSASLANLDVQKVGNFQFGSSEDTGNVTLGYTTPVSKKLDLTLSYTRSDTSPWADISGMWGETESSQTVDARVQYKFGKQITAQVGLMSTKTDIKPGLVTGVNDVQAAYAGISYNEYMANKDKLSVYAGIKPYAVNGSLDLRVPTSVDANGNMQYKTLNTRIKSTVETYAGLNYTDQLDEMTSTRYSAGVDSTGNATAGIQFTHRFW